MWIKTTHVWAHSTNRYVHEQHIQCYSVACKEQLNSMNIQRKHYIRRNSKIVHTWYCEWPAVCPHRLNRHFHHPRHHPGGGGVRWDKQNGNDSKWVTTKKLREKRWSKTLSVCVGVGVLGGNVYLPQTLKIQPKTQHICAHILTSSSSSSSSSSFPSSSSSSWSSESWKKRVRKATKLCKKNNNKWETKNHPSFSSYVLRRRVEFVCKEWGKEERKVTHLLLFVFIVLIVGVHIESLLEIKKQKQKNNRLTAWMYVKSAKQVLLCSGWNEAEDATLFKPKCSHMKNITQHLFEYMFYIIMIWHFTTYYRLYNTYRSHT